MPKLKIFNQTVFEKKKADTQVRRNRFFFVNFDISFIKRHREDSLMTLAINFTLHSLKYNSHGCNWRTK